MEQLENNEEIEFLFDNQKKKLTSPLLGSFLGKMAIAKIEKIKKLQKEKREPLIKQRDEKKARRLELRAELEKMTPITEEEEAEFDIEYQELEELTTFIDEVEAKILSAALGSFAPGHIKEKLITEYIITEVQENGNKKEEKTTFTKWAKKLDQEILEPARSRQSELRAKTDNFESRSLNLTTTEEQIKKLEAEIIELRKEIKTNREEESSKKERIKRIFNSTTRKANQLDVLIRSLLSRTKVNLSKVEGISQGEVLTVQGLRDIKTINKLVVDIIDISTAGDALIELFQNQEVVLDIIKEKSAGLSEERIALEPEKTIIELEGPKKEGEVQTIQIQAEKTKAEIDELRRQIKIINQLQIKTNKRQEEEEARLDNLQQQIDKNSEKYFELLRKLDKVRDPYSKEELSNVTKESTPNPFTIQVNTQGLDLIDERSR